MVHGQERSGPWIGIGVASLIGWFVGCFHFGSLGRSFRHLGGTLGNHGSNRKWGVLLDAYGIKEISGPHSESFSDMYVGGLVG